MYIHTWSIFYLICSFLSESFLPRAYVINIISFTQNIWRHNINRYPPFPCFLPSPFLTCCANLPTSFGGKGRHLRRWLVAQPLHQTVFWCFPHFKANARIPVHSPQDHFIITLIISDWRDWRDTQGKWPLARNPDRSWWHRHTSLKLSWPPPMAP
jgi:hypothetical protein